MGRPCFNIHVSFHVLIAAACVLASASPPCTFHVISPASEHAGGENSLGSLSNPFRGIAQAQLALREDPTLKLSSGPTYVCLHTGIYNEQLSFSSADSGVSAESPLIFLAADASANVSITGSVPVDFEPISSEDPINAYLPPSVAGNLFVSSLTAAGLPNASALNIWTQRGFAYGGCGTSPMELVSGRGVMQRTARWPNVADRSGGTAAGFALTAFNASSGGLSNASFYVTNETAPWLGYALLPQLGGQLQFHGFWHFEWADGYLPFEAIASGGGGEGLIQVMLGGKSAEGAYGEFTGGARYYLTNAAEALDEGAEYWYNSTSNSLYWWPEDAASDINGATVTVNETLLTLGSVSNVWFAGITIEGGRGHGISLTNTSGIAFINTTIRNMGQRALTAESSNGTTVSGLNIFDVGCAGVYFSGGGDRITLTPSGNLVVDSNITRVERLIFTYEFAVHMDTGGVVAHNDISDTPHSALQFDGNDVLVEGNVIHNTTRITWDTAAIYYYPTDWSKYNATIKYNFFFLNAQDPTTCNVQTSCNRDAIYPDNGSAGPNITNNVIYHPRGPVLSCPSCNDKMVSYAFFEDGTRNALKVNNLLILDGSNVSFNGGAGLDWDQAQQGNTSLYIPELHAVQWNVSLYKERYPDLALLHDWWPTGGAEACSLDPYCGPAPYGFLLSTNVIVNASQIFTGPPTYAQPAMFNISNNLITQDPSWASSDPRGTLDFQLNPNSPAYAMGFQRIPMECFGPYQRCPEEPHWTWKIELIFRGEQ